jgi:hypothetical protein
VQKAAHDVVVSLKIAMGQRLQMSCDFLHQRADVEAYKDWCGLFKDPSYRGHSFLDLKNSKDFFLNQQFIMRCSIAVRSKPYKLSTAYRYICVRLEGKLPP